MWKAGGDRGVLGNLSFWSTDKSCFVLSKTFSIAHFRMKCLAAFIDDAFGYGQVEVEASCATATNGS